jgi:hypothetical protein
MIVSTAVLPRSIAGAAQSGAAPDPSALEVARRIDERIGAKIESAGIPVSPRAEDAEFLRRVYLDLHGRVPTAEHARSFFDDRASDKRAKLIDELLADSRFASHLADVWDDYLIPAVDDPRSSRQPLTDWLQEYFARSRGIVSPMTS